MIFMKRATLVAKEPQAEVRRISTWPNPYRGLVCSINTGTICNHISSLDVSQTASIFKNQLLPIKNLSRVEMKPE